MVVTKTQSPLHFLFAAGETLASSLDLRVTMPAFARLMVPQFCDYCTIEIERENGVQRFGSTADGESLDGARSFAGVETIQLRIRGEPVGSLTLAAKNLSPRTDEEHEVLRELARRVAATIDNALLYERERRVARTFQTALLPASFPTMAGRRFHAAYLPASDEAEVGGDWYDAFVLPDGRIAISIGDVAGHGLAAAVVMGEVRQTFRVAAMERRDPAEVLDMANRLLLLREKPIMVTAIFGVYDGKTFTYASAGHPPPLLAMKGRVADWLPVDGCPLGIEQGSTRTTWCASVPTGSLLVLYTDGLTEFNRDVLAAERALLEAARAEIEAPSADPALSLRQRVLGDHRNVDDIALFTVSVEDSPVRELNLEFTAAPVAAQMVRQSVRQLAEGLGLSPDQSFALQVAVGEAVNNAVEHAYLRERGTFSVRVAKDGSRILVDVEDHGRWRPVRREGRGRGLPLIRSLVESVEFSLSEGGTKIKMEFACDA